MKKIWSILTSPDQVDFLSEILHAWRLWLTAALIGALLGAAAYALFLPPYRAQATVLVDHNIEEAWKFFPERQLFKFLSRESFKLETLAFADHTLQPVADSVDGIDIFQLRHNTLHLSHPMDGVWHLWADSNNPEDALTLASTWADSFVANAQAAITIDQQLEAKRAELNTIYQQAPDTDPLTLTPLLDEIDSLIEQAEGLSPYLEVSLSQSEQLPVQPAVNRSAYLLGGSLCGVTLAALVSLFIAPVSHKSAAPVNSSPIKMDN